jgi:hypothetical protein
MMGVGAGKQREFPYPRRIVFLWTLFISYFLIEKIKEKKLNRERELPFSVMTYKMRYRIILFLSVRLSFFFFFFHSQTLLENERPFLS